MQDQELRYRIQLDRHSNQHGELLESLFEQRSAALRCRFANHLAHSCSDYLALYRSSVPSLIPRSV